MVFVLLNLVIIGLLWMRENNVIIRPATDILIINFYGLMFSIKIIPVLLEIKEINGNPVYNIAKKGQEMPKTIYGI